MLTPVTLDKRGMVTVLGKLSKSHNGRASELYVKLMSSWGSRPDRQRITLKLGESDLEFLKAQNFRRGVLGFDVLTSGWITTYQHPTRKKVQVRVHSTAKPKKIKVLTVGKVRLRLRAVNVVRIDTNKEATVARKKKAVDEEELEELEGLEDLEDLDDEDLEDEEPDEEEDEDEEDEEEEPAPKRSRKKAAAKSKPATKSRSRKAKAEPEEDEEDEEDEKPARRSSKSKAAAKKAPAKKAAAKKSGNGNLPATRELPKGQIGPVEIAELVGGNCDDRYVRIWLRESEYEREEGSRWAFTKTEAKAIVREIKADRRAAGV